MSENQLLNIINEAAKKNPDLIVFFKRVCKNYKLKRKLQKTIEFSLSERSGVADIFADNYIKANKLYLEKAIKDSDFEESLFIQSIFKLTGIELNEEKNGSAAEVLLLKLESYFPRLIYVHEYLSLNVRMLNKYSYDQLETACKITTELLADSNIKDFSTLGANHCTDSKSIRKNTLLYSLIADFVNCEVNLGYDSNMSRKDAFEIVGVSDNPTAIKVSIFAPLIYKHKSGILFDWVKKLWEHGESAVLSLENIQSITDCWLEDNTESREIKLVTCENESPFNFMIRNEKIPVIYTAGYPNSAVKVLITFLSESIDQVYHWGDSDLDGLKIANIINKICNVKLWRCSIDDISKNIGKLKKVNMVKKREIENFITKNPDFKFRSELEFTLKNGWLEQEAFQLTMNN